jgi:hypothetical protein
VDDEGLGEFVLGGKPSPRAAFVARTFFGVLGTVLCVFGAVHLWRGDTIPGLPLRLAAVGWVLAIAGVFAFNVTLLRRWRWPLWLAALGLPLVFAVRIVLGP